MRDIALQLARESNDQKLNTLREYLQNYILFLMQKLGINTSLYFVGGTALRLLYQIRRYSEDLDFSAGRDWNPPGLTTFAKGIENHLGKSGYLITMKVKDEQTVQRVVIGFTGLLYELGLRQRKEQKLNIHIEIDLNPPQGWRGEKTIINLYQPVVVQHYELASLFAGKMHALLMRPYTKGRDIYDLFWYRTAQEKLLPNFIMLNNAIRQTHPGYIDVTEENWLDLLKQKIKSLDWKTVENDVIPFLELQDDRLSFTRENLMMLLD
ncbi:MAG: nucleotidyl transferase AbiEii/AbiGii toxin family protein [bacterium]|nr:nucleotidyl transferase AbiEii/AbiGii toxin family protein [bacterium]